MRQKNKSTVLSSSSSSSSQSIEQKLFEDHFICPILQQRMRDPVIAADGYTYERVAMTSWIKSHGERTISPMTGERLEHLEITSNLVLRQMIIAYEDSKPQRKQRELTEQEGRESAAVMGWNCHQRGEYAQAITYYKKAARRGHVNAQFNLASMYFNGQGIAKNKVKAIKWYQKAADQGNVTA